MQNHEKWKECVEMDVEAVAPLNVLASRRLNYQVSVHHKPPQTSQLNIIITASGRAGEHWVGLGRWVYPGQVNTEMAWAGGVGAQVNTKSWRGQVSVSWAGEYWDGVGRWSGCTGEHWVGVGRWVYPGQVSEHWWCKHFGDNNALSRFSKCLDSGF